MRVLVFLPLLHVTRALQQPHPDHVKCHLSKLEEEMYNHKLNSYGDFLPTLKEIKVHYPQDEVFVLPPPSPECQDARHHWKVTGDKETCDMPARDGMCTGTNSQIELEKQERLGPVAHERYQNNTGFSFRNPVDIHPHQIFHMQVHCRQTCRRWVEERRREGDLRGLEEVEAQGGYSDTVVEMFGQPMQVCDLAQGWHAAARERALSIHLINQYQPQYVARFHPVGFEKVKIPADIYVRILNNRKKLMNEKKKFRIENCDLGMQNCHRILESKLSQECHLVSRENYFYRSLDPKLLGDIKDELMVRAQEWIGNRIELAATSVYGIRRYTRGAWLLSHLDHLKSHVISAILNIKQDVEEDWPLQIFDHQGRPHEILLKPGEMVWYESASLVHGRVKPLKGKYFENIFVHYMPRSQLWYKSDFGDEHGKPVREITVDMLREADAEMIKAMEEEKVKRAVQEEEAHRLLEAMTPEERVEYHAVNQLY